MSERYFIFVLCDKIAPKKNTGVKRSEKVEGVEGKVGGIIAK